MHSMIYYPGFEIKNEKWLKFALLYFEELRPIVPYMIVDRQQYLSPTAIKIMEETDLIRPYCPDPEETFIASTKACEEFEKYINHPERYMCYFSRKKSERWLDSLRNPYQQTCCLYNGKYSNDFFHFCLENNLAQQNSYGINISSDLAFVYMSFLADIISKNKAVDMFSDISKYNLLLMKNDRFSIERHELQFKIIKTQMEFAVPNIIESIPLEKTIELRNNRDFEELRRAFVAEMEDYLLRREDDPNASFDNQLKVSAQVKSLLKSLGIVSASIYLTISSISSICNREMNPAQGIATTVSDLSALNELRNLPTNIKRVIQKSRAKRYLGKLRNIR